jgi:predicted CopG family antitoxin
MKRKMINLNEDVYNALYELKYDYRERSLSDTIAHLLREKGYDALIWHYHYGSFPATQEPFDEAGFEDE